MTTPTARILATLRDADALPDESHAAAADLYAAAQQPDPVDAVADLLDLLGAGLAGDPDTRALARPRGAGSAEGGDLDAAATQP